MSAFNPEDPKWTAYLLGECTEAEANTIEAELKDNPEAQAWLKEMRGLGSDLTRHFEQEPELELQPLQKERIQNQAAPRKSKGLPSSIYSLAAALVIVVGGVVLFDSFGTFGVQPLSEQEYMGVQVIDPPTEPEIIEEVIEPEELADLIYTSDLSLDVNALETEVSSLNSTIESPTIVSEKVGGETAPVPSFSNEPRPRQVSNLLDEGDRLAASGNYEQAKVRYEEVLVYDRYNQEALRSLEEVDQSRYEASVVQRKASTMKMMEEVEERWLLPLGVDQQGPQSPVPGVSTQFHLSRAGHQKTLPDEDMPPNAVISPSQDEFDVIDPNPFRKVSDHPLSTFSIDVDTASYSVVRKMINEGRLPPKDAVRIEEMINYFKYDYAAPTDGKPFAAHMQVADCPWTPEHHLVRVALKGEVIAAEERPALNLVYLLDVSGSMSGGNRLPLVKRAMKTLVTQLDERDRVAIVVYAGAAGVVLPSTSGADDKAITAALDRLNAGGSTAGGAGIKMAYKIARDQFVDGGVNRVILCTDGDFNVGLNQTGDLQKLIEKEAKSGVQLTVLGFGMGNYKDDTLETLSNKGNGNYAYIDDFKEARKVLVDDLLGNMITIAKDVKIQVEFNPAYVEGYRLIGYENRMLKKEDFNNDKVDAGEIGAGHTVTALYEIVPTGKPVPGEVPAVDPLKYQTASFSQRASVNRVKGASGELLTLKLRHKEPNGDVSTKTEYPLSASGLESPDPDQDFRFATAVASFGLWLREDGFREEMSIQEILDLATSGKGMDPHGHRSEFIQLVRAADSLQ